MRGKLSLSVSQTLLFSVGTRGVLPNVAPLPEYAPLSFTNKLYFQSGEEVLEVTRGKPVYQKVFTLC